MTATGKSMLAFEPPELRSAVLCEELPKVTPLSLTGQALEADLERIRLRGYAVNYGEGQPDARGIAVPVFDSKRRPIAGVGTSVPVNGTEEDVLMVLRQVSTSISRALGYLTDDLTHLP